RWLDLLDTRERRDGLRDTRDACPASRGEGQLLDRPAEQLLGSARRTSRSAAKPLTRGDDPLTHRRRSLGRPRLQLSCTRTRHGYDQVEAVEERPRQLVPKGREPLR